MDVQSLIDDLNFIADQCEKAPGYDRNRMELALDEILTRCNERINEYDADGVMHDGG